MEFLNKVELVGIVGNVNVSRVAETKMVTLSVLTEYSYIKKDGENIVNCEWHNVSANEKVIKGKPEDITKGSWVKITGRITTKTYSSEEGERKLYIIVAGSLELVNNNPAPEGQ